MTPALLYALCGTALVALGLYTFATVAHLLRKLLAFNIMASGAFLVMVGLGQAQGQADPVPQALVLTGIVVAFGSTALALVLLRRWFQATGSATLDAHPDDDREPS